MRNTRVYVQSELNEGDTVPVEKDQAHHLLNVLKVRNGQAVYAFDGTGGYFESTVILSGKKSITIRPERFVDDDRESSLELVLVQGITGGQKMDYTIQKAVELGVKTIVPMVSEFSTVKLAGDRVEKRLRHWRRIVVHACEQCGRNRIPEVSEIMVLEDWLATAAPVDRLVLSPGAELSLPSYKPKGRSMALVCGPEGGLSESELAICFSNGCQFVSMGPRTLRTETAAIAGMAVCQSLWGDLR